MSRKSIIAIIVGVVLFVLLIFISNMVTAAQVEALEVETDQWKQIEGYQLVETIRTTFLFGEVAVLLIAGALALGSRKPRVMTPSQPGEAGENEKLPVRMPLWFGTLPGILAFVTSSIVSLMNIFVFDKYGGIGTKMLLCKGLPAGVFGVLGGLAWYGIRRKSGISRMDVLPLLIIGILAGLLPGACMGLLPQ